MLETELGNSVENGGTLIMFTLLAAGCLGNQLAFDIISKDKNPNLRQLHILL